MKKLLRALKQWTLLIAIVVGAVGHSFFSQFTWLAPWLSEPIETVTPSFLHRSSNCASRDFASPR